MEIYKDLSNPGSKEFEKLLNSQLSKIKINRFSEKGPLRNSPKMLQTSKIRSLARSKR